MMGILVLRITVIVFLVIVFMIPYIVTIVLIVLTILVRTGLVSILLTMLIALTKNVKLNPVLLMVVITLPLVFVLVLLILIVLMELSALEINVTYKLANVPMNRIIHSVPPKLVKLQYLLPQDASIALKIVTTVRPVLMIAVICLLVNAATT